jgi:hypothetical protein
MLSTAAGANATALQAESAALRIWVLHLSNPQVQRTVTAQFLNAYMKGAEVQESADLAMPCAQDSLSDFGLLTEQIKHCHYRNYHKHHSRLVTVHWALRKSGSSVSVRMPVFRDRLYVAGWRAGVAFFYSTVRILNASR